MTKFEIPATFARLSAVCAIAVGMALAPSASLAGSGCGGCGKGKRSGFHWCLHVCMASLRWLEFWHVLDIAASAGWQAD